MDHCNYMSLLIFTVTTRRCQPSKGCGIRTRRLEAQGTDTGEDKVHLPMEWKTDLGVVRQERAGLWLRA